MSTDAPASGGGFGCRKACAAALGITPERGDRYRRQGMPARPATPEEVAALGLRRGQYVFDLEASAVWHRDKLDAPGAAAGGVRAGSGRPRHDDGTGSDETEAMAAAVDLLNRAAAGDASASDVGAALLGLSERQLRKIGVAEDFLARRNKRLRETGEVTSVAEANAAWSDYCRGLKAAMDRLPEDASVRLAERLGLTPEERRLAEETIRSELGNVRDAARRELELGGAA